MKQTSTLKTTLTYITEKATKIFKKKFTNIEWSKMNFTFMTRDKCKKNFSYENAKGASSKDQINQKDLLFFCLKFLERNIILLFKQKCVFHL